MRSEPIASNPHSEGVNARLTDVEQLADGGRWLTTQQAFERYQARGGDRSFDGFRRWSKRNPEQLGPFGLRATGYSGKSNRAAGFEDIG